MTEMDTIPCKWLGGRFIPLPSQHWRDLANSRYREGETYLVEAHPERSGRSHRHYFAILREAWDQLPESMTVDLPSPEHLRKFALIKCGYHERRIIVMDTPQDARRVAVALRRQRLHEFTLITVVGCAVNMFWAQSQSENTMDARTFQESKQDVIAFCAKLIGVNADTLMGEAGQSA